jgi:hypothetical protein
MEQGICFCSGSFIEGKEYACVALKDSYYAEKKVFLG